MTFLQKFLFYSLPKQKLCNIAASCRRRLPLPLTQLQRAVEQQQPQRVIFKVGDRSAAGCERAPPASSILRAAGEFLYKQDRSAPHPVRLAGKLGRPIASANNRTAPQSPAPARATNLTTGQEALAARTGTGRPESAGLAGAGLEDPERDSNRIGCRICPK